MGVIYKIKPKIKEFILEKKKKEPGLSCRKISDLLLKRFQLKLSKSAVNALLKESSLSMPVGRRRKKRRVSPDIDGLGAVMLQATDHLLRGTHYISECIKKRLETDASDILAKTEFLIYSPLMELFKKKGLKVENTLLALVNQSFTPEQISSYLIALQRVRALYLDVLKLIPAIFQEARGLRIYLSDGTILYLDAQFRTTWATPYIPNNFAASLYNIKGYINRYFQQNLPFVLFAAHGQDVPPKEFFDFILSLEGSDKKAVIKATIYGRNFEDIESLSLGRNNERRFFIFGLWPQQFVDYRKVKSSGEFKPFSFEPLKENFYLAPLEMELSQPTAFQRLTLRGVALKRNLSDKIRLIILSNIPPSEASPEQLATMYLKHWPNGDEGFQDFSRKTELFAYTASSERFFSTESLGLEKEPPADLKTLLVYYLKALDMYVRWHFLPSGYEDKDFPTVNEHFYRLKGRLKREENYTLVTLRPSAGQSFPKDLEYACRRLNEREIELSDGKRLWLSL